MRNATARTRNSQKLLHQAEVRHVRHKWNQQQDYQSGNQYGEMILAPFRDAELGENPTRAEINLHFGNHSKVIKIRLPIA